MRFGNNSIHKTALFRDRLIRVPSGVVSVSRNFLALILWLLGCSAAVSADGLSLVTEETEPFSMSVKGELTGLATDIVKKAFERAKIPYVIALYPRLRSYEIALKNAGSCVYPINRVPEREESFRWVGPLIIGGWAIFAKDDSKIAINSLDDLKPYRVGATKGDAITSFLKERGLNIDDIYAANSDELNIKKLESGRIDLWASGSMRGSYVAARQGARLKQLMIFKEAGLYMACNPEVSPQAIAKLNLAIKSMHEDGTVAALTKAYF